MTAPPITVWHSVSAVIERLGDTRFERALYEWVAGVAPVSVLFVIELFGARKPGRVLVTEGVDNDLTVRARQMSREYAEEDHAIDEILIARLADQPGQMELLTQRGEDRDEHFRQKYFDSTGFIHEVSLFSRTEQSTLYMGVSSFADGFKNGRALWLKAALPVALSLVRRHSALLAELGDHGSSSFVEREATIARMLADRAADLTRREVEVCAAIVMGFRAEAAASRLGIAPNTVATHRKRAYAKLRISSQTELFGILFSGWSDR